MVKVRGMWKEIEAVEFPGKRNYLTESCHASPFDLVVVSERLSP